MILFGRITILEYLAKWKYPVFGNVLQGTSGIAAAVICDDCKVKKELTIKFALEYREDQEYPIYHPIEELERIKRLASKSTRVK